MDTNYIIKTLAAKALYRVSNARTVKGQVERTWDADEYDRVFAQLVMEYERGECAKVCDEINKEYDGEEVSASWIAEAIRARGNK